MSLPVILCLFPTDLLSWSLKLGWQTPATLLSLLLTALGYMSPDQMSLQPCLAFYVGSVDLGSGHPANNEAFIP